MSADPASLWLARVIAQQDVQSPASAELDVGVLVQTCERHDVTALVASRVRSAGEPGTTASLLNARLTDMAQQKAVVSMLQEAELRALLAVVAEWGGRMLLLKGTALAHWAYEVPHLRSCSDLDVLVPDYESGRELARLLAERLGYTPSPVSDDMGYEFMCRKILPGGRYLELDLHWRLVNSPLFAEKLTFDSLWLASMPVDTLGLSARALGVPHALWHACMHRAANLAAEGQDTLKWLWDLRVLSARMADADVQMLLRVCRQTGTSALVLAALRTAAGYWPVVELDDLVQRLLPQASDGLQEQDLQDWKHVQKLSFQAIDDWPGRLRWLGDRLFPSKAYLQALYGRRRGGYGGLWLIRIGRAMSRLFR